MKTKNTTPTIIVIFGGTGDLAKRKLIPAFYNLYLEGWMKEKFAIIGLGRTELNDESYRNRLHDGIKAFSRNGEPEEGQWNSFKSAIFYCQSNITQEEAFRELAIRLGAMDQAWGTRAKRLFYLSVAPRFIETITSGLAKQGLASEPQLDHIIIEKPFGYNKKTAIALNQMLTEHFQEEQIYRIDHYLGKETVQNIIAFRFANTLFEPLWNRNYIDSVEISVAEKVGVEDRGEYYEGSGALRDMIQNHLLQILCMIAMEPPISFQAEEIRNRKVDVLRAVRRITPEDVSKYAVRGQYTSGLVDGKEVPGYREEKGVNPTSNTETYAAIEFYLDNWRWQGVPFFLRTGKRMPQKTSSITINFRPVPHATFPERQFDRLVPNRLTINIQPQMDILLQFTTKKPGLEMSLNQSRMVFNYDNCSTQTPEAYETLLLDAMRGDSTLFMRADQVEEAWDVITSILEAWEGQDARDLANYPAGTWGPEEAEALIAKDGRAWTANSGE